MTIVGMQQPVDYELDVTLPVTVYDWQSYQSLIDNLVTRISAAYQPSHIVGVFQGGWMVAQCIADHFESAAILGINCVGSKDPTLVTTRNPDFDGDTWASRNILLVDEVIDSGRTIGRWVENLKAFAPKSIKVAATHVHSGSFVLPDYYVERFLEPTTFVLPWRINRDAAAIVYQALHPNACSIGETVEAIYNKHHITLSRDCVRRALLSLESIRRAVKIDDGWARGDK